MYMYGVYVCMCMHVHACNGMDIDSSCEVEDNQVQCTLLFLFLSAGKLSATLKSKIELNLYAIRL